MPNLPSPVAPALPFSTGNPTYDSLIHSALIAASAALTAYIVAWLNAHKITDPNLNLMVGGAIFGVLAAIAGTAWSVWQHIVTKQVLTNVIVPQAVEAGIKLARSEELLMDKTGIPVPVTPASAAQIVKDFAPVPPVVPAPTSLKTSG